MFEFFKNKLNLNVIKTYFLLFLFIQIYSLQAIDNNERKVAWDKQRAYSFLEQGWVDNKYQSWMSPNLEIDPVIEAPREIFSTMLVLDLLLESDEFSLHTKNKMLDLIERSCLADGTYYFFEDKHLLPRDVDTTTFGITLLIKAHKIDSDLVFKALDKIASNITPEKIIEVYIDPPLTKKGRIDPVVCANNLYLFGLCGFQDFSKANEDLIYQFLIENKHLEGTHYYPSPDAFLYMLSRLVSTFPDYQERFQEVLKQKIRERIGSSHQSLELALLIIAAKQMGIACENEENELAQQQLEDGSWPAYAIFKGNVKYKYFGSREITTAFAIKALE